MKGPGALLLTVHVRAFLDLPVGAAMDPVPVAIPIRKRPFFHPAVPPAEDPVAFPLAIHIGPLLFLSIREAVDPGPHPLAVLESPFLDLPVRPAEHPAAVPHPIQVGPLLDLAARQPNGPGAVALAVPEASGRFDLLSEGANHQTPAHHRRRNHSVVQCPHTATELI